VKAAFLVLVMASVASADVNVADVDATTSVASVRTGIDQGLVVDAGYAHALSLFGRDVLVGGDATVVTANASDYQLRATATVPIVGRGNWRVLGALSPIVRGTTNQEATMVGLSTDVAVMAGRYTRRWFFAGEVGLDIDLATHVTNSEAYRMIAYPDARDGWYRTPGGTFRYGLETGVSFGRYDATLRAGKLLDLGGGGPLMPIYGTVGVAARF